MDKILKKIPREWSSGANILRMWNLKRWESGARETHRNYQNNYKTESKGRQGIVTREHQVGLPLLKNLSIIRIEYIPWNTGLWS